MTGARLHVSPMGGSEREKARSYVPGANTVAAEVSTKTTTFASAPEVFAYVRVSPGPAMSEPARHSRGVAEQVDAATMLSDGLKGDAPVAAAVTVSRFPAGIVTA